MNTVNELRAKADRIANEARNLLTEAEKATAERAAELETQCDRALADADALYARADKLEALEARSKALDVADARRPVENGEVTTAERSFDERAAESFANYLRGAGDFDRSVLRAHSTTTGSEGGYLVPTLLANEIIKNASLIGPMLDASFVRVVPTATGADLNWPTYDVTQLKATKIGQNVQASAESMVFGQKALPVYEYKAGPFPIPAALLTDSVIDINGHTNEAISQAFAIGINEQLTIGDGSGDPNGVVTAATSALTAASATVVTADELIDLAYAVNVAYHSVSNFMFNQTTLAECRKMKDSDGRYIWQAGDFRAGVPSTILGFTYRVNSAMPNTAAGQKSVLFGDFSKYFTRTVEGVAVKRLVERYADYNQVGFIAYARFGGNLMDTNAVKAITQAAS